MALVVGKPLLCAFGDQQESLGKPRFRGYLYSGSSQSFVDALDKILPDGLLPLFGVPVGEEVSCRSIIAHVLKLE